MTRISTVGNITANQCKPQWSLGVSMLNDHDMVNRLNSNRLATKPHGIVIGSFSSVGSTTDFMLKTKPVHNVKAIYVYLVAKKLEPEGNIRPVMNNRFVFHRHGRNGSELMHITLNTEALTTQTFRHLFNVRKDFQMMGEVCC